MKSIGQHTACEIMRSRCHAFPARYAYLTLDMVFSAAQFERISQGFTPRSMDDRWFIYLDALTLYVYRSWSGYCLFLVPFRADMNGGYRSVDVRVNRDPSQYRRTDNKYDESCLLLLIDNLLLSDPPWNGRPDSLKTIY